MLPAQKAVMHPQIFTDSPSYFMVWWTCWGPTRSPSPIQHHDISFELNLCIFVSSLKIMHFQSSMVQFSYLWASFKCMYTTSLKTRLTTNVKQHLTCFIWNLFCCRICSSKSTFCNENDTMPLLTICKKFWTPSSLCLNLAPYIFP